MMENDENFISKNDYIDLRSSERDSDIYYTSLDSRKNHEISKQVIKFNEFRDLWNKLEDIFIGFKACEGNILGFSPVFINGIIGYGTLEKSKVKIEDVETALQTEPEKGRYCFNHVIEEVCLVSVDIQSLRLKEAKPLLPKSTPVVITEEQKKLLGKHIKNLDEILEKDDVNELFKEIFLVNSEKGFLRDSILQELHLFNIRLHGFIEPIWDHPRNPERNGERRSPFGRKLNRTYYEIFDQSRNGK